MPSRGPHDHERELHRVGERETRGYSSAIVLDAQAGVGAGV